MLGVRESNSGKIYNPDNKKNRKQTVIASGIILNEDNAKQSLQNILASAKNPITTSEEQNKNPETHKSRVKTSFDNVCKPLPDTIGWCHVAGAGF